MALDWKFPRPRKEKELQSYPRMAIYYRKFIPSFSKIAAPLHALLKKDTNFECAVEHENHFQN
jgi:hypothetical protein